MTFEELIIRILVGIFVVVMVGLFIWATVGVQELDDRCDHECQPFNRFRSDGKLFTVCRDIDGGFQIREVK